MRKEMLSKAFFKQSYLWYSLMIACLGLVVSCQSITSPLNPKPKVEQFWFDFVEAMEENDTNFLHQNSLPFIECAECDTGKFDQIEFKASTFFTNYPKLLLPPEDSNFNIQIDTVNRVPFVSKMPVTMHRVNYSVTCQDCPEGGYNIIYTLIEVAEGEFRFQGKFSVP